MTTENITIPLKRFIIIEHCLLIMSTCLKYRESVTG